MFCIQTVGRWHDVLIRAALRLSWRTFLRAMRRAVQRLARVSRADVATVAIVSDTDPTETLRAAERRLQAAQLASDVPALTELLDEAVLFTGPDGNLYSKEDDLGAHRSGHQVLHRIEELELRLRVAGPTGVSWFLGILEGAIGGELFAARMRYTRTWTHDDELGWRIIAAHATFANSD